MKLFSEIVNSIKMKPSDSDLMRRLVFLIVLFFVNHTVLGQNKTNQEVQNLSDKTVLFSDIRDVSADNNSMATDSKMDLFFWLMGSKPAQNFNGMISISKGKNFSNDGSLRKKCKNAGMATHGVLYRTFFKKIINYESTIA